MKTMLICHEGAGLDREGLARWLGSFSELIGIIVLRESSAHVRRRIRNEIKRIGPMRFLDTLAYRLYDRICFGKSDSEWEQETLAELRHRYAPIPAATENLLTANPNSAEAEEFIRRLQPDILLARCKFILAERIFTIPRIATLVMHPGVCPEYRNAHGCFWALVRDEPEKVGMTLLRVDKGVDTGPIYGYYSYRFDGLRESPRRIQHRVALENLEALRKKFLEIESGSAGVVDASDRESRAWGQPWLSSYLRWRSRAKRRAQ